MKTRLVHADLSRASVEPRLTKNSKTAQDNWQEEERLSFRRLRYQYLPLIEAHNGLYVLVALDGNSQHRSSYLPFPLQFSFVSGSLQQHDRHSNSIYLPDLDSITLLLLKAVNAVDLLSQCGNVLCFVSDVTFYRSPRQCDRTSLR